ncbi:hypothetical protein CAEBREN_11399 [Caenorhabditis brenneri]|uniref:Uncharacterized protein n=1 Tax=Caenorhabditis brenneri TaxID=135651 RepID=G0MA49_CAEBE|nr:hypothetical protein CAEBREN_11399 [Caenorhabditis brenneri]
MNSQNELNQKLLMFTVVRLCHVFNTVLNNTNISDAVLSSLRGYSSNFSDFHEALQLFFDTFCRELEGLGDLKLMTENLKAENKFNVTIQFNYSALRGGGFSTNDYDPYPGSVSPDLRDRNKRIMISEDGEQKWQPETKKRRFEEFSEVNVEEVQELMSNFEIDEGDIVEKDYIVKFPTDEPTYVADKNSTLVNIDEHNAEPVDAENLSVEAPMLHDAEMAEETVMNQAISGKDDISIALKKFSFEEVQHLMSNIDLDGDTCEDNVVTTVDESILVHEENLFLIVDDNQDLKPRAEEVLISHDPEMDMEHTRSDGLTENTGVNKLEEPTSRPDPNYNDQFSSIDDEMERDFQQKLAEQNRLYEEKLANIRKKRIEKNEAALMEIRAIEERIRRARH